MAAKKKFDIESPTDEMIENLEAPQLGEEGLHITKLRERAPKTVLDLLKNPLAPNKELKKTHELAKRLILNYGSYASSNYQGRVFIPLDTKSTLS